MYNTQTPPNQRDMARLHPAIYKIMLGLVLWMLLAAWGFVAGGYSAIALGMVTFFLVVTTGLVAALWRISRRNRMSGLDKGRDRTFSAWLDGEFDTWGSRLHGTHAATQIILPIAAAAVGMTLLMIVLHLDLAT
jgi:FtsH-binding integral membrane protein